MSVVKLRAARFGLSGLRRPERGPVQVLRPASIALALLLAAAQIGFAYISITMGPDAGAATGLVAKQDPFSMFEGRMPYWINLKRPAGATPVGPNATEEEIIQHIQNAFQTWENVATARAKFSYLGLTDARNAPDGMNVVTFDPVGINTASDPIAFALLIAVPEPGIYRTSAGTTLRASFPAQIVDGDLVVNPRAPGVFTVSDDGNPQIGRDSDLQGALVHEVGHFLGLGHTNAGLDGVMNMNVSPPTAFEFRNLSTDDVIGVSSLYPAPGFLESRGNISGTIRRADGNLVFGAHVVAMSAQTGVIVTSTLSGLSEVYPNGTPRRFSVALGDYRLVGLPPGTYRIYAEPLDMSNRNPVGGIFANGARQTAEFDFSPTFLAGTVTVGAGEFVGKMDITVEARSADAPVLGVYSYVAAAPGQPFTKVALARRGTTPRVFIPVGANLQSGPGLVPGTKFEFSGGDVTVTSVVSQPGSGIFLSVQIAPDAALGPRLLQVTTGNGVAFMTGGLVIVPPPPVIRSVTRETSPTGTTAIIDGENFASPSLPVVMFNGRVSTGLTVESDKRLRAGVPPGAENATDVRVITLSGVARNP